MSKVKHLSVDARRRMISDILSHDHKATYKQISKITGMSYHMIKGDINALADNGDRGALRKINAWKMKKRRSDLKMQKVVAYMKKHPRTSLHRMANELGMTFHEANQIVKKMSPEWKVRD